MRSKESNNRQALASLKKDLVNGPISYSCFGHHTRCSLNFCTTTRDKLHVQCTSSFINHIILEAMMKELERILLEMMMMMIFK